jgi:hypothetical protein
MIKKKPGNQNDIVLERHLGSSAFLISGIYF